MIILFEGHNYPKERVSKLAENLKLDVIRTSRNGKAMSFNCVGYFYSTALKEQVFVLPKVFIYSDKGESEEEDSAADSSFKAFGQYDPNNVINFFDSEIEPFEYQKADMEFIRKVAIWIYLAIRRYDSNPKHNNCIRPLERIKISINGKSLDVTLLDLVFGLVDYAKEYRDFIIMIAKMCHSGNHRINWSKTISNTQPVFNDDSPVYASPIRKKKEINYDEELMVIFFSTLQYINRTYHQDAPINEMYHLMSIGEYNAFKNIACQYLMRIKHRYFSDKTVKLWNLLYNYYKMESNLKSNRTANDMLLCKKFDKVFEEMIDYLLSDESDNYPSELSEQWDGKLVDHIYRGESLIYNDDDIYYVGDSKYYKSGNDLERKSLAKQYTYAKNIIQRNIEVFFDIANDSKRNDGKYLHYRDELTEGYDITPNFFISGSVRRENETLHDQVDNEVKTSGELEYSSKTDDLTLLKIGDKSALVSRQFKNRLFDRDTLILQRYNINFLYVLSVYCKHSRMVRDKFKSEARGKFKTKLVDILSEYYTFYVLEQKESGKKIYQAINENYKALNGKIISYNGEGCVYLALSNQEIDAIKNKIEVEKYEILFSLIDDLNIYKYDIRDKKKGERITLKLENIEDDLFVKSIVDDCHEVLEATNQVQLSLSDEGIYNYAKMEANDWHRIITKYYNERKTKSYYPDSKQMEINFPSMENVAEDLHTRDE